MMWQFFCFMVYVGMSPLDLHIVFVNLPFTYAMYFFFLCGQNAGTVPGHPLLFILFRTAEKERIKKKAAARNSHSFENACHG